MSRTHLEFVEDVGGRHEEASKDYNPKYKLVRKKPTVLANLDAKSAMGENQRYQ